MAIGFFETPPEIAYLLSSKVMGYAKRRSVSLLDACAGRGQLGLAALETFGSGCSVTFLEIEASLTAQIAIELARRSMKAKVLQEDIFGPRAANAIQQADVILCNPPFMRYSKWRLLTGRSHMHRGARHLPDIACHIVLEIAEHARNGTVIGLIQRRDACYSRGYVGYRTEIDERFDVLDAQDLGRTLRPCSGAAAGVLLVLRKKVSRSGNVRTSYGDFPEPQSVAGWRRLGSIATVKAGPSVRACIIAGVEAPLAKTMHIPRHHDGSILWGHNFFRWSTWDIRKFSAARNLRYQGHPGVVYRLAGSDFRTAILPAGVNFFSDCPAIQPLSRADLDFVTGCSLLPAWRRLVRTLVRSTNFTPSAVSDVPVPAVDNPVFRTVQAYGAQVRAEVAEGETQGLATIKLDGRLKEFSDYVDSLVAQSIDGAGLIGGGGGRQSFDCRELRISVP